MGLQQLMNAASRIYQDERAPDSLQAYLKNVCAENKEYSIVGYLQFISNNEDDDTVSQKCSSYAQNIEHVWSDRTRIEKIILRLDKYFSMYSIGWIVENWGQKRFVGNTKIQKIAFLTNFKEHLASRHEFGFGEPFLSYHYGPWSLSLQQDIELLKSTGLLKIEKDQQGLEITNKGKFLASTFEDFINTIPHGKSFLDNISHSSEIISDFRNTQDMLEYFYSKFPVFYDIKDRCISVSSRVNGQIRISDMVLKSAKEDI